MANTPIDSDNAGVKIQRMLRMRHHFCNEYLCASDGIVLRALHTFADLASGKWSRCASVLRSQPRTIFCVNQAVSPFFKLLVNGVLAVCLCWSVGAKDTVDRLEEMPNYIRMYLIPSLDK